MKTHLPNSIYSSKRLRPHDAQTQATEEAIDREIASAYERAREAGEKPPNLIEIVAPVRASLAVRGYFARFRQIQAIAKRQKYAQLRLPAGNIAKEARKKGGGD